MPNARTLRTRSGWALLFLAFGAHADSTTLGDIDVASPAGQVLDATITLGTAAGAPVGPECIFLSRGSPEDGPFITRASVAVFEAGGERFLRLKSAEPVRDANTRLRVVVRCPGQPHVAYREYRALFAPKAAPAPIAPPVAVARTEPASGAAAGSFPVRPGDTMQSLAALIFPRNPEAQRAYVDAMRARNPKLASLGPRDPLPADATLELPDLRTLPRVPASPRSELAQAPSPPASAPPRVARPSAPRPAEPAPPPRVAEAKPPRPAAEKPPRVALDAAPKPAPAAPAPAAAPPRTAPRATPSDDKFVLRLSSPEVDLSRSRNIDDRARAKLRERLLVLDADDQVAALLSLRDSVKRLEGRVAELQLKLSTVPSPLPPPKVEATPPKAAAPAPKIEPPAPKVEPAPAPKIEPPPKVEPAPPPKIDPPKIDPPKVEPPKVVPPPAPKIEPPKAAPKPATKVTARPDEPFPWNLVIGAGAGLLALLVAVLAWRALRARRDATPVPELDAEEALPDVPTAPPPPTTEPGRRRAAVDIDVGEPARAEPKPEPRRREIASDQGLATEVHTGDPAALRRRYMEERFPEIANGTIVLGNPESVVKAARLFYEDGAVPRAVELLQYATEDNPAEQKPWLALFEIYRLERLAGPFADLAQRYRDLHGKSDNWRKVQYFGREIDPGNALYRDLSVGIETIRFESGKPPAPVAFDPVAENWLDAPMDFENELLVVELRRALMVQAQVSDEDLVPNPMPALRSVEMFTVA